MISLSPKYQQAYALSGAVLVHLNRHEEAVPRLKKAIELDQDDMQSVANLGVALRKLGKNAEAIAVMDAAIKRKPDDPDLLNNLGVALRQERRYEEAIVHLQHALELRDDVEQHRNLAITLRGAERYKEAIPQYEAVLAKNPNDVGALYDLANCYEKLGDNTHAASTYRRYVEVVRTKDPAAAQRGEERIKQLGQGSF
ncbi:MAG TPA: tetratricopeptide repeat protein [Polyangiaceae bacterium]|nr:tetratricopeptide repeat protein [Polyangiaceae bacterium]